MPNLTCSVAMCTYNGATYLQAQLQSLAAQQRLPDEVVICDDGSSDGTVAIAERFGASAHFPVRIFRNEQNLGYSRNFAKAVQLCSGDLIALADQDDLWHPQKLERLGTLFAEDASHGGIFSNGDLIGPDSEPLPGDLWGSFAFTPAEQARLAAGQALRVLLQRNVVTGMAFAFHSSARGLLHGMPASWPHDAWLALMLAREGRLHSCPEHLVAYRVHGHQQIGVPITLAEKRRYLSRHGLDGYLQLSRDRNSKEYAKTAREFHDLVRFLEAENPRRNDGLLQQARAKAEHAQRSLELLSTGRLRRFMPVLRGKENYRRYSPTGAKAMLRDLLL